jgi:hypothetical protein
MRARLPLIAAFVLGPVMALHAGDATAPTVDTSPPAADTAMSTESTPVPSNLKTSYEFDGDTSYVGDARTNFGGGISGKVSEQNDDAKFLIEPQFNDGPIYRFGLSYERYNFGLSQAAPVPDALQAENLVVGMDFQLFNSWLVRVEADPGFYTDGRDAAVRGFNVPFTIGGSYISGEDVQWVLGLEVDINRQIPVFPAVGLRWQFRDQWVLDLILPTPRLEFDENKNLAFYLGADVDDGTYRVDQQLGVGYDDAYRTPGTAKTQPLERRIVGYSVAGPFATPIFQTFRPAASAASASVPSAVGAHLGGTIVEYDEVRIGAGMSWKASKALTFELECGYLPYREFDFHRADVHFSNNSGAPYGQMSLTAQF